MMPTDLVNVSIMVGCMKYLAGAKLRALILACVMTPVESEKSLSSLLRTLAAVAKRSMSDPASAYR